MKFAIQWQYSKSREWLQETIVNRCSVVALLANYNENNFLPKFDEDNWKIEVAQCINRVERGKTVKGQYSAIKKQFHSLWSKKARAKLIYNSNFFNKQIIRWIRKVLSSSNSNDWSWIIEIQWKERRGESSV